MIDSISCNLPCQKAQFEETSYSLYFRTSLIALGSISFFISMLIFYRVPGMNSLGMSGGWTFFGCGFAALLGGVLVRCKEKTFYDNKNIRDREWLGNRHIAQTVEPCPLFCPFDNPQLVNQLVLRVFAFLTPKNLVAVAGVSNKWKDFSEEESLWQHHCLRVINHPKPPERSWRNHYRVLSNWMAGRAQYSTCELHRQIGWEPVSDKNFTLLSDGSVVGMFFVWNIPDIHKIRNLVTHKVQEINFLQFSNHNVTYYDLQENFWIVMDQSRQFFCFDLMTAQCLHHFPEFKEFSHVYSSCYSGNEIILWQDQKIVIRNLIEAKEPLLINIGVHISNVWSTPNFVIISSVTFSYLQYVNKSDLTRGEVSETYTYDMAATSGPYLAVLNKNNLKIYKDIETELQLCNTINCSFMEISHNHTIQMFQNWVAVSNLGLVKIWNAESGIQIAEINHGIDKVHFVLNSEKLVLKSDKNAAYNFYDFSAGIRDNKNFS